MSTATEETHAAHKFVAFRLGDEEYALPIGQIQEVIRYTPPRPVASEDGSMIGVISLRGKIVPVGDLAGRLGLSAASTDDSKILIVETGSQIVGMIVDSVDEVLSIEDDQLDTSADTRGDLIRAIAKLDKRLVVILDSGALGIAGSVPAAA